MYRAKAVGGPLDNVVIIAESSWSGTIRGHSDGRYTWNGHASVWKWIPRRKPNIDINTSRDDASSKSKLTHKKRSKSSTD